MVPITDALVVPTILPKHTLWEVELPSQDAQRHYKELKQLFPGGHLPDEITVIGYDWLGIVGKMRITFWLHPTPETSPLAMKVFLKGMSTWVHQFPMQELHSSMLIRVRLKTRTLALLQKEMESFPHPMQDHIYASYREAPYAFYVAQRDGVLLSPHQFAWMHEHQARYRLLLPS